MNFYEFKKKNTSKIILLFIILLFLSIKLNFFKNIYLVLINDVNSRMLNNYGYCYPMGYGYIKKVTKKFRFSEKDININNKLLFPSSTIFVNRFNSKNISSNQEILLNYKNSDLEKIKKKFKILDKEEDCYFIEYKND